VVTQLFLLLFTIRLSARMSKTQEHDYMESGGPCASNNHLGVGWCLGFFLCAETVVTSTFYNKGEVAVMSANPKEESTCLWHFLLAACRPRSQSTMLPLSSQCSFDF
jgi:hypothetical protein